MQITELKQALQAIIEDGKVSTDEKRQLRELVQQLKQEKSAICGIRLLLLRVRIFLKHSVRIVY